MKWIKNSTSKMIIFILLFVIVGMACQLPITQQAESTSVADLEATIVALQTQIIAAPTSTEIVAVEETLAPSDTPEIKQPDFSSSTMYQGFYALQNDNFVAYDFDGNPLGMQYPGGNATWYGENEFVGFFDGIYYSQFTSNPGVFQVNAQGTQKLDFIDSQDPVYISVSPDHQYISWATSAWNMAEVSTEIHYANLDGSNQQLVNSISGVDNEFTIIYIPLKWLDDGRLVYATGMTGIGGYLLFWGYNGLFVYNPADGSTTTLVDDQERLGICLSSFTDSLDKVAIVCGGEGGVRVRTLSSGTEISYPILQDQTTAGAARFSPSGEWLAYVIQRADPSQELGKVVVVPVDGSQAPQVVATAVGGSFVVEGWIDDDSFLVSQNLLTGNQNVILKIAKDGSDVSQIAEGLFLDFIHE